MMRHKFTIGAFAVAFALSTLPAAGQEKGGGSSRPAGGNESGGSAGSRSSGSGSATGGTAVSRGGGGADSGGSTSRSSGGGMSGGSVGSSSSPSMPSSSGSGMAPTRSFERAPQHASSGQSRPAGSRSNGGESTGRSAVPRGSSSSSEGSSRDNGSVRNGGSTSSREVASSSGSDRASDPGRRAVPAYSRPRDGRPVTGSAVDRGLAPTHPITGIPGDIYYIYRPYYYPYGFWGSAYGFGLGYLYYDPFWYGSYGGGYGGGYGYPGYSYGGSYSSGGYSQTYHDTGNLRLKIKPRDAQVFVDGYFVGVVDSFDGSFQRLSLDGGTHKVEIKADGFEPLQLDVLITPGETVTYKGDMKQIR